MNKRILVLILAIILVSSLFSTAFAADETDHDTSAPQSTEEPQTTEAPVPTPEPTAMPEPAFQAIPEYTPEPSVALPEPTFEPTIQPEEIQPAGINDALDITSGDYDYSINLDGDSVTITKYHGSGGSVEIPTKLGGYTVAIIGYKAFQGCSGILNIIIPDGAIIIEDYAFCDCSLTSITIPNSVCEIGEGAFWGCSNLVSVFLSSNVSKIGLDCFGACTSLKTIDVDELNLHYKSVDGVLFNNSVTELIRYPAGNTRPSYTIPAGITALDVASLEDCGCLENITLPDSLTTIGKYTFSRCEHLKNIDLPANVEKISYSAFSQCYALESINFPDSILSIEPQAFSGCEKLSDVTLPTNLLNIGYYAFEYCQSLTSITIPDSVTSIGIGPFSGCENLSEITVGAGNKSYKAVEGVLFDFNILSLIQYPANSDRESYTIPASVTSIGYTAFNQCGKLKNITIPEGLKEIVGDYMTFSRCGIESITLPASISSIVEYVFCECMQLKAIYVDENNLYYKSINGVLYDKGGTRLLQYPAGRTVPNYTIPDGVAELGRNSLSPDFSRHSFKNVYIPVSVIKINDYAFGNFSGDLEDLTIYGETGSVAQSYANTKGFNFVVGKLILATGVKLDKNTLLLCPGETATLTATVSPAGAVVKDVIWTADNWDIAWVQDGKVTISGKTGNAIITATTLDGGYTDTCNVRVEPERCVVTFIGGVSSVTVPYGSSVSEPYMPVGYEKCFCGWYPTDEYNTAPVKFPFTPTEEQTRLYAKWEFPDFTGASGDYKYWVKNGEVTITRYTGGGGAITIPSTIDGYPVKTIGVGAFMDNKAITGVTIPDGITAIGFQAFCSCTALQTVRLPRGLKVIEGSTFNYCPAMKSVIIPEGVTTIQSCAFNTCWGMADVTIPESVTRIENSAFAKCGMLKKAYFKGNAPIMGGPEYGIEPDGSSVFRECGSGFTVRYIVGKAGFTDPWYGYHTEAYESNSAYTVHYETYGYAAAIPDDHVGYNAVITAPAVTARPGYYFIGWYTDDANNLIMFPYTVYGSISFNSKWALSPVCLSNINLSAGQLSRAFSKNATSYKILLAEGQDSVTLTPIKEYDGATMTINKKAIPRYTVSLANGKSAKVTVKVAYGRKSKTYTFTVSRAKSTNNALSSLNATAGAWSQPFDPNVLNYTLTLDENTKSAVLKAAAAMGKLAGVSPASSKVTLNNGQSKKVKITVKAQSGARRTYTITVTRAPSTNADLKSLKAGGLTPVFNPAQTSYNITLPSNKSSVTLSAGAVGYKAKVTIDGLKKSSKSIKLLNGQSVTVRIVVTSQAGNTKEYIISVTRQ